MALAALALAARAALTPEQKAQQQAFLELQTDWLTQLTLAQTDPEAQSARRMMVAMGGPDPYDIDWPTNLPWSGTNSTPTYHLTQYSYTLRTDLAPTDPPTLFQVDNYNTMVVNGASNCLYWLQQSFDLQSWYCVGPVTNGQVIQTIDTNKLFTSGPGTNIFNSFFRLQLIEDRYYMRFLACPNAGETPQVVIVPEWLLRFGVTWQITNASPSNYYGVFTNMCLWAVYPASVTNQTTEWKFAELIRARSESGTTVLETNALYMRGGWMYQVVDVGYAYQQAQSASAQIPGNPTVTNDLYYGLMTLDNWSTNGTTIFPIGIDTNVVTVTTNVAAPPIGISTFPPALNPVLEPGPVIGGPTLYLPPFGPTLVSGLPHLIIPTSGPLPGPTEINPVWDTLQENGNEWNDLKIWWEEQLHPGWQPGEDGGPSHYPTGIKFWPF